MRRSKSFTQLSNETPTQDTVNELLGWVFIRVLVQKPWSPNHSLRDLVLGHKIGPKLEDWFLKLEVFS